jgi:hypothetical protein
MGCHCDGRSRTQYVVMVTRLSRFFTSMAAFPACNNWA